MDKETGVPADANHIFESLTQELANTKALLHEQQSLFNSITEGTLAGYWIWKIRENTMFISPHLKAMLGYNDDELENAVDTIHRAA